MKLSEVFSFDREQAMADFEKETRKHRPEHDESSMGDFIISKFEAGEISFDEARQQLIDADLGVWVHELNMAAALKDSAKELN